MDPITSTEKFWLSSILDGTADEDTREAWLSIDDDRREAIYETLDRR